MYKLKNDIIGLFEMNQNVVENRRRLLRDPIQPTQYSV